MPRCVRLKRKHRKICIGDLNNVIDLQERTLTAPSSGVDATETFIVDTPDVWAKIETVNGETIFDGTNTDINVTHRITIRFLPGITAETWVLFNGERLDILDVQNFEERDEWLLLKCTNRGTTANAANEA